MMKHIKISVCGHISHQGYRFRLLHLSRQLNIKGTVSEAPGCLLVEAEGEEERLKHLIEFMEKLPSIDLPLIIEINEFPLMYYDEFRIV